MEKSPNVTKRSINRRSMLKGGLLAGSAAFGTGLLVGGETGLRRTIRRERTTYQRRHSASVFRRCCQLIETDLWLQYAELGCPTPGQKPVEVAPFTPMNSYQAAFMNLDPYGPQDIASNTLDEASHANFLNAYLESKGADPVDLYQFRTLRGSQAKGAKNVGRLTNLMHLNVDTSWFIRYRSTRNPDSGATFPQAVTIRDRTAIPITDADFDGTNHIQAIANTAAFHFGTIEQGGSVCIQLFLRKQAAKRYLESWWALGEMKSLTFWSGSILPAMEFNPLLHLSRTRG